MALSEPDINVYFVFCDKETDCFRIRNKKTLHFAILWFNDGINFAILCIMG